MLASEVKFELPSFEEIKLNSLDYFVRHGLTEMELDLAHTIVKRFHNKLFLSNPSAGEVVVIKDYNGNILRENAHIEEVDSEDFEKQISICDNPAVPFVSSGVDLFANNHYLKFDTSGGPWRRCNAPDLIKTDEVIIKKFKAWGRVGMVGCGAFYFTAPVRVWTLNAEH